MLILKIKDKGLFLDIPGVSPTRTPAEIDISKCDLSLVTSYLRKNGINDYQIFSVTHIEKKTKEVKEIKDPTFDKKDISKRFTRLEKMVEKLIKKDQGNDTSNKEQITNKLQVLEELTRQLLRQPQNSTTIIESKEEPDIEELDKKFIPDINVSKMKLKGKAKTIKQDKMDLDDSVDLLSRIIGKDS